MIFIQSLAVFAALMILGCHSTPLRSPAGVVKDIPVATQAKWLKDYKWAKEHAVDEPMRACDLLIALSSEILFPARQVAELRSYDICPVSLAQAKLKPLNRASYPDWLQDMALGVALKWAQNMSDKSLELDLAAEKSRLKLPQNEKVAWIKLAISRAEELKDPAKLADLNRRLYGIAPRLNPAPREKEFLAVAQDFRVARQFPKAKKYYDKVINGSKSSFEEKLSAFKGLRLAYKNARQKEPHLATSKRLVRFLGNAVKANPKSKELILASYEAQTYLARAQWTLGMVAEAKAGFDRLEKQVRGRLSLAEIFWLKGRMAEENDDFKTVSSYMDRALKERITDNELRDKILWYAAWNERRQKNFARATELFSELQAKTQTEFTRFRALFWLARTQADSDLKAESRQTYDQLITMDPLGYYGLLAHGQIQTQIAMPTGADKTVASMDAFDAAIPLDKTVAEWLRLMEEREVLTAMLDQTTQIYKKQKDQSDDGWTTLFKYYAKAGLYMKLYENLGTLSADRRKAILEMHPELLFPQPWSEEVRAAAIQFGVDEELIFAIMRQESAFDTQARSFADAFGLLQVLPELAERLGPRFKIPYKEMDDLYVPKTNIMVGAAHLHELVQNNKGRFIPAVASYNASANVVQNWVKTRFRGDPIEFVEEIPYEETRAYVRLVLRNVTFYTLLRSKTAAIDFPSRLWKMAD